MRRIDAHQHFWQFDRLRDSWINADMKLIQADFMPPDLEPVLTQNGFDGCVVVQSDQSEQENEFQLSNAAAFDFIKGVVGWVDLQSEEIEDKLAYYHSFKKLKGFRHVLQGERDRALMLKPSFMAGIGKLQQFGFTYDILIYADQLKYIPELVTAFPTQKFVLDHIAKPDIKGHSVDEWKKDLSALKDLENLQCKISGMVTEANWQGWRKKDFKPYLDVVVETFGTGRIMYGSDWPVCLVAASYEQTAGIVKDYFEPFSSTEKDQFFGLNATRFYNL